MPCGDVVVVVVVVPVLFVRRGVRCCVVVGCDCCLSWSPVVVGGEVLDMAVAVVWPRASLRALVVSAIVVGVVLRGFTVLVALFWLVSMIR